MKQFMSPSPLLINSHLSSKGAGLLHTCLHFWANLWTAVTAYTVSGPTSHWASVLKRFRWKPPLTSHAISLWALKLMPFSKFAPLQRRPRMLQVTCAADNERSNWCYLPKHALSPCVDATELSTDFCSAGGVKTPVQETQRNKVDPTHIRDFVSTHHPA